MITLEPQGGLANRMRVIASGLWLMKESNQELEVIWNLNEDLNCNFDLLFHYMQDISIIDKREKDFYVCHTNHPKLNKRIKGYFKNRLLGMGYCINEPDFYNLIWKNKMAIDKIARKNKNIYISTCQEFGSNYNEFKFFLPSQSIQQIIDEQVSKFNKNTIGIHIRRTDNVRSIAESPIELFISKMEKEVEKNSSVNFFLATDDKETEQHLLNRFGSKIIVYKKVLDRNLERGIIDAVVDMYCLSNTKYIYGSYWSSFSDIASRVGNIELKVLIKS
jgi:hypothetical protein